MKKALGILGAATLDAIQGLAFWVALWVCAQAITGIGIFAVTMQLPSMYTMLSWLMAAILAAILCFPFAVIVLSLEKLSDQ